MKELRGNVSVVTGGASGLGRAMALAFAREGMHVAIADVDAANLERVAAELRATGVKAFAARVDVSKAEQVDRFAQDVLGALGGVHVVCNNAGVAPIGAAWESTLADWEWTMGVNLWGVIHGVRAFTPMLLAQNEGHIVNTASVAGLINPPSSAVYNVTKHGVVALSETLHHDLDERNSKVGVSVLCPAYVPTGIADSARNRPVELSNPESGKSADQLAREEMLRKAVTSGKVSAEQVARAVVDAVKENRFYILTHPRINGAIRARMEAILAGRPPSHPMRDA
ncbi:MAG: SDR family NAD(P)-dependent oxidoreductase [Betaproteobacteria bacterium]|nr:SDR family NAD(P)-dependent oxidoreductase [Betaproteobacteria bacterium]